MTAFQFHYGSIRTYSIFPLLMLYPTFNSIMVQLEQADHIWQNLENSFQFHYGSIRTILILSNTFQATTTFQFHYGSIRTRDSQTQAACSNTLSIPLWFN